jgi:Flp pilus assembly protein TadD
VTPAAVPSAPHPDRAELEALACHSLTKQDFRGGLAPLSRLLLALVPDDPERPVVLACLAVAYARLGRTAPARRALRDAEQTARSARALGAVALARGELAAFSST